MRSERRNFLSEEGDPLAGVANLFDVAMVFAVALMVAVAVRLQVQISPEDAQTEAIRKKQRKLDHWRVSKEHARGQGTRLGTAYRLESGEVVYVPE